MEEAPSWNGIGRKDVNTFKFPHFAFLFYLLTLTLTLVSTELFYLLYNHCYRKSMDTY